MSKNKKIEDQKGTWVFTAPIKGLRISKDLSHELRVDRVTFVESKKFPRIRKRLGFPITIGEFQKKWPLILDDILRSTTFVSMRMTGKGTHARDEFLRLARDELSILSLSQLGYSRRRHSACLTLGDEKPGGHLSYLMMNIGKKSWSQNNSLTGKIGDLHLDDNWLRFHKSVFFVDLLTLLRPNKIISSSWRKDIRNAAILAGQSQNSSDLTKAFLWNMIALETLLTRQGDTYVNDLPARTEAFIGWASDWKQEDYEQKLRTAYKKRCAFVHSGNASDIKVDDVLFLDLILLNLFSNITKHPKIFKNKDAIISFSEKIQAERLLGIKPRIRPKTFGFTKPIYTEMDYVKI